MKECVKCGHMNNDENMFCSACGEKIESIEEELSTEEIVQEEFVPEETIVTNDETDVKTLLDKNRFNMPLICTIIICIIIAVIAVSICIAVSGKNSKTTTSTGIETTIAPVTKVTSNPVSTPISTPKATVNAQDVQKKLIENRANVVKENYGYVEYSELARNPNNYEGKSLSYEGKVIQVLEDRSISGLNSLSILMVVGGNYDNLVRVTYIIGNDESRILEDDYIHVYGTSNGLYSYETVRGNENTIPEITADLVE